MNKGAIIVGYQGVGKSTACSYELTDPKMIDFESSCFKVCGIRDPNWYKVYGNIAVDLAKQGFIVFTASHKAVRDYLASLQEKSGIDMYLLYPGLHLKDEWIRRLTARYKNTDKEKDRVALLNAEQMFEDNIRDMKSQSGNFKHMQIVSLDNWPDHKNHHMMYDAIMSLKQRVDTILDYTGEQ